MKKTLATIGATGALAFAGLGAATMASAQATESTDDTVTEDGTESTDDTVTEDGTVTEDDTVTEDGRRGRGHRDGEGRRGGHGGGCGGEAVAELLGMEAEELRAELDAGSTLAEIAEANGVDPDALVDQMVADATERIEQKVAEDRLTEDEAAEKLAERAERIEDRVFGLDSADEGSDA